MYRRPQVSDWSRRRFLQSAAASTLAAAVAAPTARAADTPAASPATAPSRKLNLALVGVGGRGMDHVREIKRIDLANVVAICDVDAARLVDAARIYTNATPYVDFRDAINRPDVEAVLVATPDHTHAVITAAALRAGKHVYCEKPLAHTVAEVRAITKLAAETKRVTQLGIQIHALDNYRRVVEWIRAGTIGRVAEVHIWNHRTHRPVDLKFVPPPASLNYDLWLGPVAAQPFRRDYHPYNWRRYLQFGEAMLGDIFCHLADVAFWALDLKYPTRITADGGPRSEELCPEWNTVTYDFPARGADRPAVRLTWYDPPKRPPMLEQWKLDPKFQGEGVMFVGEHGQLYANYSQHVLLPQEKFATTPPPPKSIPSSSGHQREWIEACLKNDPLAVGAPFSYGGPLSEAALLGLVAFRANKPLEWDAPNLKIPNYPDAEQLLSYRYRDGWSL
jgi:predicted dehydrogenase